MKYLYFASDSFDSKFTQSLSLFLIYFIKTGMCCMYGGIIGYDCLDIPGAENVAGTNAGANKDRICGRSKGLRTAGVPGANAAMDNKSICCEFVLLYKRSSQIGSFTL